MTSYQQQIAVQLIDDTQTLNAEQLAERIAVEIAILEIKLGMRTLDAAKKARG